MYVERLVIVKGAADVEGKAVVEGRKRVDTEVNLDSLGIHTIACMDRDS